MVKWGGNVREVPSELVRPHNPLAFWAGMRGPLLLIAMKLIEDLYECWGRNLVFGRVPSPQGLVQSSASFKYPEAEDTLFALA